MKLLNPQGCSFPCGRGNEKERTMIVEVHGIGFWTRVQIPPGPFKESYTNFVYFVGSFAVGGMTVRFKMIKTGGFLSSVFFL